MISFFKNLFNGILSFFSGLFGGKKSQKNKPSLTSKAQELTEATASKAQDLAKATTSKAQELTEATASKAQKLTELTPAAEKLSDATAKSSSEAISSISGLFDKKSQDSKSQTSKKRKRNDYFMELDETESKQSVNGNQPAKTEPAKTEPAKTPAPAAAKTDKQEPVKTQVSADKTKKVELVQTAGRVKEVVTEVAKPATAVSANGQKQSENTFAPKYLTPTSSNSRRRPGPSMSSFLDMARQVKSPS